MADTTDEIKQPNMNYINMLKESANSTGSIVCMGLDPVMEALPNSLHRRFHLGTIEFYDKIFRRMKEEGVSPGAFKPNQGFFEMHNNPQTEWYEGSKTLEETIFLIRESFPNVPIILDYKKGDIAKSSENYAKVGVNWKPDALTVAPYMGTDSVMPFVKTGLGIYVLDRTSNPGGADFQNLRTIKDRVKFSEGLTRLVQDNIASGDAKSGSLLYENISGYIDQEAPFLYEAVADKILEWSKEYKGVGAVFGATAPDELIHIAPFFAKNEMMLLIPGVGGQGGSLDQVLHTLRLEKYPMYLARINSSSEITHPWIKAKQAPPKEWDVAITNNVRELNTKIDYKAA